MRTGWPQRMSNLHVMADRPTSGTRQVRLQNGEMEVEAELIAKGLELDPAQVQHELRSGSIKSTCETGMGEDGGTYRLTFRTSHRRFRVVVDEAGHVLKWSKFSFPQ